MVPSAGSKGQFLTVDSINFLRRPGIRRQQQAPGFSANTLAGASLNITGEIGFRHQDDRVAESRLRSALWGSTSRQPRRFLGQKEQRGNELLPPLAELLFPWRLEGREMCGTLFLPGS